MSNSRRSLCEWWVIAADQQRWSLLTYRYIKQFGGTVTIVEIGPASNITLEFFIWGVTYLLKNESYRYNTDWREWSSVVTHNLQSNSQMRNCQSMLFRKKTWKFRQKELKICSGECKNLWSFNYSRIIFVHSQTHVTIPLKISPARFSFHFLTYIAKPWPE